jgi:hypothetical protein
MRRAGGAGGGAGRGGVAGRGGGRGGARGGARGRHARAGARLGAAERGQHAGAAGPGRAGARAAAAGARRPAQGRVGRRGSAPRCALARGRVAPGPALPPQHPAARFASGSCEAPSAPRPHACTLRLHCQAAAAGRGRRLGPGVLGQLAALADVLDRSREWAPDAAAVRARMLAVYGDVAERYLQQGAPHARAACGAGVARRARAPWPALTWRGRRCEVLPGAVLGARRGLAGGDGRARRARRRRRERVRAAGGGHARDGGAPGPRPPRRARRLAPRREPVRRAVGGRARAGARRAALHIPSAASGGCLPRRVAFPLWKEGAGPGRALGEKVRAGRPGNAGARGRWRRPGGARTCCSRWSARSGSRGSWARCAAGPRCGTAATASRAWCDAAAGGACAGAQACACCSDVMPA